MHLRPNKAPVFKKGAHVHWMCKRNGMWIKATVSDATNARVDEYEVITDTGEHKQTLATRLRPATERSQTLDVDISVCRPDGPTTKAAQGDIEPDTGLDKTGHDQTKPTPELTHSELQGLTSVDIRSAMNGWVPAVVVSNDGTPKHSYLVSRNGGPPGRLQAEDVRTRRKPDIWLASNDGHQATRLHSPMQHATKRYQDSTNSSYEQECDREEAEGLTTWCTPNTLRPGLLQHGHTYGTVLCPNDEDARNSTATKQKCLQKRRRVNDIGMAEHGPGPPTTTKQMRKMRCSKPGKHPSIPVQVNQLTIVEKEKVRRRLFQYHCATGHCSRKVLKQMLLGSQTESLRRLAKHINLLPICTACLVGKSRKKPHKQAADSRSKQYLHRLHIDITGRQRVASLGGNYYCMIIVDDATRKAWAFPMKRVTDAAAVLCPTTGSTKTNHWMQPVSNNYTAMYDRTETNAGFLCHLLPTTNHPHQPTRSTTL